MCTSPSYVWVKRGEKWAKTPVPCDRCWMCRENYVSDWVGRCLCEASTSEVSCTISLTYAPPKDQRDISHRVVKPLHFQLFMKRLRKAGHKIRYFVAGEYGDLRQRSHFHAILFFTKLVDQGQLAPVLMNRAAFADDPTIAHPFSRQIPQQEMVHISEWPHGHIEVDWSASEKAVRYCCEYLYRDGKRTAWLSMSKKPPLGFAWFAAKAAQSNALSVLPSTFQYMPPGGKPGKKYLMTGATRRDFLNLITKDASKRPQMSKWVRATFDKLERQDFVDSASAYFDDTAFLQRHTPEHIQNDRLIGQEFRDKTASDQFLIGLAKKWGFDSVEEFEAFAEAGGCQAHPEYFSDTVEQDAGSAGDQGHSAFGVCTCAKCEFFRARASEIRARIYLPPRGYDREGNPYWTDPDREYLAGVFDRDTVQARGEAIASDGLQTDPPEEE